MHTSYKCWYIINEPFLACGVFHCTPVGLLLAAQLPGCLQSSSGCSYLRVLTRLLLRFAWHPRRCDHDLVQDCRRLEVEEGERAMKVLTKAQFSYVKLSPSEWISALLWHQNADVYCVLQPCDFSHSFIFFSYLLSDFILVIYVCFCSIPSSPQCPLMLAVAIGKWLEIIGTCWTIPRSTTHRLGRSWWQNGSWARLFRAINFSLRLVHGRNRTLCFTEAVVAAVWQDECSAVRISPFTSFFCGTLRLCCSEVLHCSQRLDMWGWRN